MKLIIRLFLTLTLSSFAGCGTANRESRTADSAPKSEIAEGSGAERQTSASHGVRSDTRSALMAQPQIARGEAAAERGSGIHTDSIIDDASAVSLASISTVYAAGEPVDRKIIRNADLTLETESPTEGLRKITAVAESYGGFVVTSEFKQNPVAPGARPNQSVTVVARVPASQFASALGQIRSTADRVVSEKVSGQDVSEEFLDVEARLRNKKALEGQFLEIMKQAHKVEDALDVQTQLADVRTEIERLEGRRRFLENQAALSTITTTLQMPQPIVAATTSGFGTTITRAFGDAVDTAVSIFLFVIQALIVMVPITVFFGLPGWLLWRVLRRRFLFRRPPEPSPIPSE